MNRMQRGLMTMLLVLGLLAPRPGYPLDASRHRQLVVVVTDSWGDFRATLYRFGRAGEGWVRAGKGCRRWWGRRALPGTPLCPSATQGSR